MTSSRISFFRRKTRPPSSAGLTGKENLSKKKSSSKKSIFRVKTKSSLSVPSMTWSMSESSSFDAKEEPSNITIPSNHSVVNGNLDTIPCDGHSKTLLEEMELLQSKHAHEMTQMEKEISKLKLSQENLTTEHQVSEDVIRKQEFEIFMKDDKIKALQEAIDSYESKCTSDKNEQEKQSEDQREVIHRQRVNILLKSDEINSLNNQIQDLESTHARERCAMERLLNEKDKSIRNMNERLTIANNLVSQTASLLLKPKFTTSLLPKQKSTFQKMTQNGYDESVSWTLNAFDMF